MKTSSKSVIYSAVVFPGAGYFILSKKKQAMVFLALTLSCLCVIFYDAYYKAQIIADKIVNGYLAIDINVIRNEIQTSTGIVDPFIITSITIAIGLLWLLGIVDCYRIGRSLDENNENR
ncbi:MAG: hypothetical protein HRU20_07110 [Pseudomonadales bacterium]|nr:hypothetical protein [Pseudomonadales bacterium]